MRSGSLLFLSWRICSTVNSYWSSSFLLLFQLKLHITFSFIFFWCPFYGSFCLLLWPQIHFSFQPFLKFGIKNYRKVDFFTNFIILRVNNFSKFESSPRNLRERSEEMSFWPNKFAETLIKNRWTFSANAPIFHSPEVVFQTSKIFTVFKMLPNFHSSSVPECDLSKMQRRVTWTGYQPISGGNANEVTWPTIRKNWFSILFLAQTFCWMNFSIEIETIKHFLSQFPATTSIPWNNISA